MENTQSTNPTKEKHFFKRWIFVVIFLLLVAAISYVNIQGEYLQMLEMGEQYLSAYTDKLQYNGYTFLCAFIISFLMICITTAFIKSGLKKFFMEEKKDMPKLPNKSISLIFAMIASLVVTPGIAEKFILATNATYFGVPDPIFNIDIGYYIFQKPFIELIFTYLAIFVVALAIYVAVYYIVVFNRYFDGVDLEELKKSAFIKQLIANLVILAVLISGLVLVKSQDILYANLISSEVETGLSIIGAGIMDVSVILWGYRILAVLIIVSVIFSVYYIVKKNKRRAVISLLLVPAFVVCLFLISVLYNLIFINNNEFDKQKEYISYNIANTKNAYNINIQEKELTYSGTLTLEEMDENQDILQNIPIVDENVTLTTLKEYQSNVGFYSFNNIHMAKYNNSLEYVAPREIITSGTISSASRVYEYTHGYSAIITSAVQTDEYGNVKYIKSDFNDSNNEINISEPRIYFGMETKNNIIVNANNQKEYDYPLTTTTNATNIYDGDAGIKLNFWDRFILGLKLGNVNIAFGIDMNEDSKILTNRQILDRAKKVLPEIMYDDNPYLVITDEGRLVWVIDGYTVTNQYPYSTRVSIDYKDINYIRNSVKVLVDAYNGNMKFYITDRDDPIIMAYNKIYPTVFASVEESIPDDIQEHLTYPKFLYDIQAKVLTKYHNVQPEVLYRNDDIWDYATYYQAIGTTGKVTKIEPYYTMVDGAKLGLVLPYTEYNKKNINAYLVGTSDNGLTLYKFNINSNVLGPVQLENQIEEDETISAEIKSISVTGTKLLKNTLIIPIENTVLYVEPIYQVRLNENQIPVLKKVIVASGNKLAIGDNLKEALDNLLSQYAVNIEIETSDDIEGMITQIIKANNNLKESSSNSDWELMGKDIQRLQELIYQLEQLENAAKENIATAQETTNTVVTEDNMANIIE